MQVKYDRGAALFIFGIWLATRLAIAIVFFGVAQHFPSTTAALSSLTGLERLNLFDGGWYASIVETGYSFEPDGKQHNIAFFPLFPLAVWILHQASMPIPVATVFINNAAFLGMLFVVFGWAQDRSNVNAARWTIATLCFTPMSIFGSTAYSEGLFMLLSAFGLRSLEIRNYRNAFIAGLFASLVRLPAIALAPAYALVAALSLPKRFALLLPLAPVSGFIVFSIFCRLKFGNWLAFIDAQAAWRTNLGFNVGAWRNLFGAGIASIPILHIVMILAVSALWLGRNRFPLILSTLLAFIALFCERWAWNGSEYVMLFTIGSVAAAIVFRRELGRGPLAFVLCSVIIIVFTGAPISVDRYGYAIVPGVFALALVWRRFPAFGYAAIIVMSIDLVTFALRFARGIFVA
jgi:hypothetical protein